MTARRPLPSRAATRRRTRPATSLRVVKTSDPITDLLGRVATASASGVVFGNHDAGGYQALVRMVGEWVLRREEALRAECRAEVEWLRQELTG